MIALIVYAVFAGALAFPLWRKHIRQVALVLCLCVWTGITIEANQPLETPHRNYIRTPAAVWQPISPRYAGVSAGGSLLAADLDVDGDFAGDLQDAFDAAQCGDVVLLGEGEVYTAGTSPFFIPATVCPDNNRITVRTDNTAAYPAEGVRATQANSPTVATVTTNGMSNNATVFMDRGASGWTFIGIKWTTGYDNAGVTNYRIFQLSVSSMEVGPTTLAHLVDYITFDRVLFDGGDESAATKRGLTADGQNIVVKNSSFEDFHINGDESNCWAWLVGGPHLFENNDCLAAGINALVGGDTQGINSVDGQPIDITYRRNHFRKDPAWQDNTPTYTEKNTVEFKNAAGVLLEGNIIEHSWEGAQNADCLLFSNLQGRFGYPIVSMTSMGGVTTINIDLTGASPFDATNTFPIGAYIYNRTGDTPNINSSVAGVYTVTPVDADTLTIPVDMSVIGMEMDGGGGRIGQPQVWNTLSQIVVRNNIIRNCGRGINIGGRDGYSLSEPADDILIENNAVYGVDNSIWCPISPSSCTQGVQVSNATNVVWKNNTIDSDTNKDGTVGAIFQLGGDLAMVGLQIIDNFFPHGLYGIFYDGAAACGGGQGTTMLNTCVGVGQYTVTKNIITGIEVASGLNCGNLPAGNTCEDVDVFDESYPDRASGIYVLPADSPYRTASSTSGIVGVDMCNGEFPDPAGDASTYLECDEEPSTGRLPRTLQRILKR